MYTISTTLDGSFATDAEVATAKEKQFQMQQQMLLQRLMQPKQQQNLQRLMLFLQQ
jgi:hypothetical protein